MKISIITACLNNASTISYALESVGAQNYENLEHIVIDGSSTDGTREIIEAHRARIASYRSEPDAGIYDALNKGLELATGDVIGILHSDDVFSSESVISSVVEVFKSNPEVAMVFGNATFVTSSDLTKVVRLYSSSGFRPYSLRFGFMPAHTATFIRKSVFDCYGGYNNSYRSAGDFELFVRLLGVHRLRYTNLDRTLVRMRLGGVSTSGFRSYCRTSKEIVRALTENGIYSNWVFVLVRLPIKKMRQLLFRV